MLSRPVFAFLFVALAILFLACGPDSPQMPMGERLVTPVSEHYARPWTSWFNVQRQLTAVGRQAPEEPYVEVSGNGPSPEVVDYFLVVGCVEESLSEGPVLMVREDLPPWRVTGSGWDNLPVYYELDGELGEAEDWRITMDAVYSSVSFVPPPEIGNRIIETMLKGKTHELFVWADPDGGFDHQMNFSTGRFREVTAPVLERCGTEELILLLPPTSTPAPTPTSTPRPTPAPTPTRSVSLSTGSPAQWWSWEMVKDELTALGEEPGEPFVGVFGGGTYVNAVNYVLLFGCNEDGPDLGPTVTIREDWSLGFMNESWEIEVAMHYEIDGEAGWERDWTMTMDASESSIYYRPPPTVGVRITKALLTEGTRELFVWLNPEDPRIVQMIFSTAGLRGVAAPVLEHCGTEEQLALFGR